MTFTLREKPKFSTSSGGGDDLSRIFHYLGVGTPYDSFARAFTLSATSAIISTINGTLYRGNIDVDQNTWDTWNIDVHYQSRKSVVGEWTWDSETSGGTQIKRFGTEVAVYPNTEPTNYGYLGDEGSEEIVPVTRRCVHFKHPAGIINASYANYLDALVPMVNSAPFMNRPAGEVKFVGWNGSGGDFTEMTLDYFFDCAKNVVNATIGTLTGINCKAWERAVPELEPKDVTISGVTYGMRLPKAIRIVQTCQTGDLASLLGFG